MEKGPSLKPDALKVREENIGYTRRNTGGAKTLSNRTPTAQNFPSVSRHLPMTPRNLYTTMQASAEQRRQNGRKPLPATLYTEGAVQNS